MTAPTPAGQPTAGERETVELITEAIKAAGPGAFSPEVQAQVDDLLGRDAPPISPEFRQRLIAAAERGLAARREAQS